MARKLRTKPTGSAACLWKRVNIYVNNMNMEWQKYVELRRNSWPEFPYRWPAWQFKLNRKKYPHLLHLNSGWRDWNNNNWKQREQSIRRIP